LFRFFENQLDSLFQLVYPPICICCDGAIEERNEIKLLCSTCLKQLEPVPPDYVQTEIIRRLDSKYLDNLFSIFQFNEIIQTIIHRVKYQKGQQLACRLGQYARKFSPESFSRTKIDVIIPVPLYGVREKERGFNQSLMIAKGLFSTDGMIIQPELLLRSKPTRSQTEMGREERKTNVYSAFVVPFPAKIKNKYIALVDDVVTTGATLNECARELKKAGAERVVGLTIATPVIKQDKGVVN